MSVPDSYLLNPITTMLSTTSRQKFTATQAEPVTIYYCKANIKTGNTVRLVQGRNVADCTGVHLSAPAGAPFHAEMVHGNSKGKAKASGARCVLLVTSGIITPVQSAPTKYVEFACYTTAVRLFSEGKPVFVIHEMAEEDPIEVTSLEMLNAYSTGPFLTA